MGAKLPVTGMSAPGGGTDRTGSNAVLMTHSALLLGKNSSSVAAAAEEALANTQLFSWQTANHHVRILRPRDPRMAHRSRKVRLGQVACDLGFATQRTVLCHCQNFPVSDRLDGTFLGARAYWLRMPLRRSL